MPDTITEDELREWNETGAEVQEWQRRVLAKLLDRLYGGGDYDLSGNSLDRAASIIYRRHAAVLAAANAEIARMRPVVEAARQVVSEPGPAVGSGYRMRLLDALVTLDATVPKP
jgi:hypothetical protein